MVSKGTGSTISQISTTGSHSFFGLGFNRTGWTKLPILVEIPVEEAETTNLAPTEKQRRAIVWFTDQMIDLLLLYPITSPLKIFLQAIAN